MEREKKERDIGRVGLELPTTNERKEPRQTHRQQQTSHMLVEIISIEFGPNGLEN